MEPPALLEEEKKVIMRFIRYIDVSFRKVPDFDGVRFLYHRLEASCLTNLLFASTEKQIYIP